MCMEYGLIMKQIREQYNISQKDIARILGIARSSYKQFELQYDIIPLKRLNMFCNYFDLSIDYILGLNKNRKYDNSKKNLDLIISGQRLKSLRKEKKMTQVKLASILNIAPCMISEYEKGKYPISTCSLYMICKYFKVSADYITGKIDEKKELVLN